MSLPPLFLRKHITINDNMKDTLRFLLVAMLSIALASCGKNPQPTPEPEPPAEGFT